jgi:hypothetical protein
MGALRRSPEKDNNGCTPLHIACRKSNLEMCEVLEKGAKRFFSGNAVINE